MLLYQGNAFTDDDACVQANVSGVFEIMRREVILHLRDTDTGERYWLTELELDAYAMRGEHELRERAEAAGIPGDPRATM